MTLEERYSCLSEGVEPEEIVLLMGKGCFWKKCTFCDYHLDQGNDAVANVINTQVLSRVTGVFERLVALNSGSYFELSETTRQQILAVCHEKKITHLHMESHWLMHQKTSALKETLASEGILLHPRIGIETFDENFREEVMIKGMGKGITPEMIASVYDECCLLFGMEGQTKAQFLEDVHIAKKHFNRVYINIFNDNTTGVKADTYLIDWFKGSILPELKKDPKICILIENTDLGVGD
ncbi:MAG: radical SAM protein [Eubacterium sp.]